MSGTSCDGLDIAVCSFHQKKDKWAYEIIKADTIQYDPVMREQLLNVMDLRPEKIIELDIQFGKFIGQQVNKTISDIHFIPDIIASHGHTVFHRPERGFTLQIGNGLAIMQETSLPVINDFRSLDVILGGQGAPLVPVGDSKLFGEYDLCLNLGGISNVSFARYGERIAYDITPANIVLNYLASRMGHPYDIDGQLSESGKFIEKLFDTLNEFSYYKEQPPKSLGIERIRNEFYPLLDSRYSDQDILRTCIRHIAYQINKNLISNKKFIRGSTPLKVLVTGGGARNPVLMQELYNYGSREIKYIIPEMQIVDYKEAMIFAFLGVLRMIGETNVLSSVTGAKHNSCSGAVFMPDMIRN